VAALTEYPTYVLYGQGVTYGTSEFYYGAWQSQGEDIQLAPQVDNSIGGANVGIETPEGTSQLESVELHNIPR